MACGPERSGLAARERYPGSTNSMPVPSTKLAAASSVGLIEVEALHNTSSQGMPAGIAARIVGDLARLS